MDELTVNKTPSATHARLNAFYGNVKSAKKKLDKR